MGQVKGDAALAPVDAEEVAAIPVVEEGSGPPGRVSSIGVLDFDNVGTQVTQDRGGERPGQDMGEV